jgi:hypothetical protein
MRIQWQKFLAVGAISTLAALAACQVEVIEGPPGAGGTGGSGGTGGTGGAKADAAPETGTPDAPSGDAPTADGTGIDATTDAGGDGAIDAPTADVAIPPDAAQDRGDASTSDVTPGDTVSTDGPIADAAPDTAGGCFAEDPNDGGTNLTCAMLPYYGALCRDDGGLDWPSAGETLCTTLRPDLKATALLELLDCLEDLPGGDGGMDACGTAHNQGADDCSRSIFNRSMCPVPDGVVEGGLYGCSQIAASCGPDSGAGGIPVALCQAWLGPFNAAARQGIIDCYLGPTPPGTTSCRDKFENHCVFH